jgi:hypothetical protein
LEHVRNTLQCLLSEEGFTDAPLSGCPAVAPGQVNRQEIDTVVRSVVDELKRRGVGI